MPSKSLKSVSLKRLIKNTPATIKQAVRNELKRRQQNKQQTTARFSKPNLPTAQVFREQAQTASEALSRSGRSVNQVYRKLSGQALDVAVTPLVVGELPDIHPSDDVLTFYVLAEYSRPTVFWWICKPVSMTCPLHWWRSGTVRAMWTKMRAFCFCTTQTPVTAKSRPVWHVLYPHADSILTKHSTCARVDRVGTLAR